MKTVGIIAEFNPFHKGHEYLIRTLKKETGSDYAVIIMSGDYTQRGAPAILDKYTRTKMALLCGADLVLELPIYYSTSSAEFFAGGAVSILNNIGVTDYLGFGSESGDISSIKKIAALLADEPSSFSKLIKDNLKNGMNYAAARADALGRFLCKSEGTESVCASEDSYNTDAISSIISSPNDILATEYVKALLIQNSTISPYAIKRVGDSYNEEMMPADSAIFASAKAIRSTLESGQNSSEFLPEEVSDLLLDMENKGTLRFTSANDFSRLLYYKLLSEKNKGFSKYLDVSPDLSDKIIGNLLHYTSFTDFITKLKSKDLTYTRISRALLHILLGMTSENLSLYSADRSSFTSYARILGFNKNASPLLKKIQECSSIPVISTLSDSYKMLDDTSYMLLSETISASNIYDLVRGYSPVNEYAKPPVIVASDTHKD